MPANPQGKSDRGPGADRERRWLPALRAHLLAMTVLAAMAVVWTWPLALHFRDRIPGAGGDNFATRFSNLEGSHQTSLGLFRTADTYVGSNGYSLRLDGLEAGVNDRARERAIVMHGAPYVSDANIRALGRLGRSHGCPALRPAVARRLIDTIKDGSLVFAYYPDQQWLNGSRFLNGCS